MIYKQCLYCRRKEFSKNGVFTLYKNKKELLMKKLVEMTNKDLDQINEDYGTDIDPAIKVLKEYKVNEARKNYVNSIFMLVSCEEEFNPGIQYYIQDDRLIEFLQHLKVDTTEFPKILQKMAGKHFCIHTHSIGYTIIVDPKSETVFVETDDGKNAYTTFASLTIGYENINKTLKKLDGGKHIAFALNLLTYMLEYPEQIRQGIPSDINGADKKMLTKSINRRKNISISDWITPEQIELVKKGKSFKCPHLRKRHVRHFYSDRFVNMKGKEIVIEAMEVKGHSKIIHNKYRKV